MIPIRFRRPAATPVDRSRARAPRRAAVGACLFVAFAALSIPGCSGEASAPGPVQFTIPTGASLAVVTDTLAARDLVRSPGLFRIVARLRGDDRGIRAGRYEVPSDIGWNDLLDRLVEGRMLTFPLTIPEGFTLRQISERIASFTEQDAEVVEAELYAEGAEARWSVPGPGLEGYLFPDTYFFAPGHSVTAIVETLVQRHRSFWTDAWHARADSLGFTEGEITTLASIVQAEAVHDSEMPTIAGVYHNRLRIGMPLQADPTVQYALGDRRSRLLYADIDSVADHPYNTYTRGGLPPGPIGAPGRAALEATLYPADVPFLYFVARPDGTHIFTSSLDDHNRARVEARREWDVLERSGQDGG